MALLLGVFSLLCALIVGYGAYRRAIEETHNYYCRNYLERAKILASIVTLMEDEPDNVVAEAIETVWRSSTNYPKDAVLCLIDQDMRHLLHISGNHIESHSHHSQPQEKKLLATRIKALLGGKRFYVGPYTSLDGEEQIAAFVSIPTKNWFVVIHLSKPLLISEVRSGMQPWVIGFLVICGVLMPGSLALLYRVFRRSEILRCKTEDSLRESRRKYQAIFEQTISCVFVCELLFDVNGNPDDYIILEANSATELNLGRTVADVCNRKISEFLPAGDVKAVIDVYAEVVEKQKPVRFEMYFAFKDQYLEIEACPMGGRMFALLITDVGKRKRVETKLAEKEMLLSSIIEGTEDAVFVKDLQGKYLLVNSAGVRRINKEPEEILGLTDKDVFPESEAEFAVAMDREVISTRKHKSYEHAFNTPDGDKQVIWVNKFPKFANDGSIDGIIGITRNITQHKKYEKVIAYRDRILTAVAEAANLLLKNKDIEEGFHEVLKILGHATKVSRVYALENQIDDNGELCITPQFRWVAEGISLPDYEKISYSASGLSRWKDILENENVISSLTRRLPQQEQTVLRQHGTVSIAVVPVFVASGWWGFLGFEDCIEEREWEASEIEALRFVAGLVGSSLDRLRAENELTASHKRFQTVMDSLDAVVYVADMENHELLFANQRLCDLENDELVGKTCWRALQGQEGPCDFCTNDKLIAEDGKPAGVYTWEIHKEQTNRWYLMHDRAIRWIDGRLVRLEIATDITEQKKNEAALAAYQDHLEEMVTERTRELEQSREKLRESERLATIGTLSAGIAHEINNPVGMIMLSAQNALAVKERSGNGELMDTCLKSIIDNAKRCGRITRSVLQFAKQEKTEKWPCDVNAIIKHAIDFLEEYILEKNGNVEFKLDPQLPEITANPVELEQVVVNLIKNGIEAKSEYVKIEITTETAGESIIITVRDDGDGISEIRKGKLFDPFYTTRREFGGTGLGLSIAHGIITGHGGTIKVDSKIGKGTVFTIELPVDKAAEVVDG